MDNETQKVVIIDDEPTTLLSLESAVESIADGFITINAAGDVTFINPVAQRLTGYSETEALGKPIDEVMNLRDASTNERLEDDGFSQLSISDSECDYDSLNELMSTVDT